MPALPRALPRALRRRAGARRGRASRPRRERSCSPGDWPGNVRELANVVERAVTLSDGEHHRRRGPAARRCAAPSAAAAPAAEHPRRPASTCRPTSTRSSGAIARAGARARPAASRPRRRGCSRSPSGRSATGSPSSASAASSGSQGRHAHPGGGVAELSPLASGGRPRSAVDVQPVHERGDVLRLAERDVRRTAAAARRIGETEVHLSRRDVRDELAHLRRDHGLRALDARDVAVHVQALLPVPG